MAVVNIFLYVANVALLGHYGTMVVVLFPHEPTNRDRIGSSMVATSFHFISFHSSFLNVLLYTVTVIRNTRNATIPGPRVILSLS